MTRTHFIALVEREQESLRRFLLALCCGHKDEADDIAQETLVKAYLASDGYSDQGKFTAWIFRIAYNTFLDHRRSSRHYKSLDEAGVVMGSRSADESFEYQDLYAALHALSEKERTALLLFYIKGYSVKEISQIVGSSTDAVKQQLSRGREQLKKKLTSLAG